MISILAGTRKGPTLGSFGGEQRYEAEDLGEEEEDTQAEEEQEEDEISPDEDGFEGGWACCGFQCKGSLPPHPS